MFIRIQSTQGDLGTIKFTGTIPQWNEEALGIEWDNPTRGKNNGCVGGVNYFDVCVEGAGSFIKKSNKKVSLIKKSFVEQLNSKYASEYQELEISFGSKTTETLGFEKLSKLQADFSNLGVVSLSRCLVGLVGNFKTIAPQLCHLHTLDLSFNLLELLEDVWSIVDSLSIKSLNLSGNRFENSKLTSKEHIVPVESVTELNLTSTLVSSSQMSQILAKFPNLNSLAIADNRYSSEDVETIFTDKKLIQKLKKIDLSGNALKTVPDIVMSLEEVNLGYNMIQNLSSIAKWAPISKLHTVDVRKNELRRWSDLDILYMLDLEDLRINGNPLFAEMSVEDMTEQIVARLHCGPGHLMKLNGAVLTESEISNAELYFTLKVRQNEIKEVNLKGPSWQRLAKKYGIEDVLQFEKKKESHLAALLLPLRVLVTLNGVETVLERAFLRNTTIMSVQGFVSGMMGVSALKVKLSYIVNESDVESEPIVSYCEDSFALLDSLGLEAGNTLHAKIEE